MTGRLAGSLYAPVHEPSIEGVALKIFEWVAVSIGLV